MVEGVATESFSTLVQLLEDMADAAGSPVARLAAAVGALMRAVDATAGILVHGGPDGMEVRGLRPLAPATEELPPEARVTAAGDEPLLGPVRAGGTVVSTAARSYGPAVWQDSPRRRATLQLWDVDQLVALPVRSGPEFVVVLLGRLGQDFTDEDLQLLQSLRPVMAALTTILEPELLPEPGARVLRLTHREHTILGLLSHGHTAVRIAHLAGCSPRTVHHHLANIYAKLGVRDRLSAVNRARELGLVQAQSQPRPLALAGETP